MELTSPHLTGPRPAFAPVFLLHFLCFLFSLSLSLPASVHLHFFLTSIRPTPLPPACPPRCVALPGLAILCVLIKNATLFTFLFFCCVPSRAQGSHRLSCITAIWRPSRSAFFTPWRKCAAHVSTTLWLAVGAWRFCWRARTP